MSTCVLHISLKFKIMRAFIIYINQYCLGINVASIIYDHETDNSRDDTMYGR